MSGTDGMSEQDRERVGGVMLAAGQSSRYGPANKLLARLDGTPVVRHVAETACKVSLSAVVVVVGHEHGAVVDAVSELPLSVAYNPDYASGQSTSVRRGVECAVAADWDAAVFLLGDMPFVQPATVDRIVDAYRGGTGSIVVPRYDGVRGNPVLFDSDHFEALAAVSGDRGGRALIERHDGAVFIDVDDPGVRRDIDTQADLASYTE